MTNVTYGEMIDFFTKFTEDHGSRIARHGLGSKADVRRDVEAGMQRIWMSTLQRPPQSLRTNDGHGAIAA
jgi:hypothetical protein